jgi:hypothetical protein
VWAVPETSVSTTDVSDTRADAYTEAAPASAADDAQPFGSVWIFVENHDEGTSMTVPSSSSRTHSWTAASPVALKYSSVIAVGVVVISGMTVPHAGVVLTPSVQKSKPL